MKSLLGALLFPVWYLWFRMDPIGFGTRFLRGAYLEAGVDQAGVPLQVSRELSELAFQTITSSRKFLAMAGSLKNEPPLIIAFQQHLLFLAHCLRDILQGKITRETALIRHPKVLAIMERHWR